MKICILIRIGVKAVWEARAIGVTGLDDPESDPL